MARRSRGDGSVFYDATRGCWVGSIDIGRDPQTRRRRRRKVSAQSKSQCIDKLDELRSEFKLTGTVAPRNTTVENVVRALLANPPAEWKSHITIQVNTDLANRIIRDLGGTLLMKLTVADVEWMLGRMAAEGMATKTITAAKSVLRRAIRRAQRDGLVGRNVAELADTPRGTRRESRSLTLEQIRQLFASDLTPWMRAYLMTGILCGLRPGELTGMTWPDVDFDAGVIRVRHSLKAVPVPGERRSVLELADLKTDKSRRTIALPGKVADALRGLRAVQAAERLRLGQHYGTMNLVFCTAAGRPVRQQTTGDLFRSACSAAGLGADWHPHEQRHSFVSVLSDAGIDIEAIADAAGHVNSNVTRTVYRHAIADKVSRAAEAMDQIFGTGSA